MKEKLQIKSMNHVFFLFVDNLIWEHFVEIVMILRFGYFGDKFIDMVYDNIVSFKMPSM